ncbi:MAG: hypothetical protein IKB73_03630 [Ruminococcus sp.]|nr:hypothetical protein [Ruminococcus sp.]
MKIAYAGFDLFYPMLECLYDNGCEIVKIFTCNVDNDTEFNTEVTDFAQKHDIAITYDRITENDIIALKNDGVDALFCAAYYYRIPVLPDFKMINVHPSLLPMGRGAWPMPLYILNSYEKAGVTFHKMAENFDDGDIIMQKSFELCDSDNLSTFMKKAYELLPSMVKDLLSDFSYHYENAKPQTDGEYWKAPDEDQYTIDEDTDFETADRILRAFYGFYVTYIRNDEKIKLKNAVAVRGDNKYEEFKVNGGYIMLM